MEALSVIAIILVVLGIAGSVLPGLPGLPLSWVALLLVYIHKGIDAVSVTELVVWTLVVVVVSVIDYIVPSALTRMAGGHKAASWGAVIGLFAGMFLTPVGMIAGSLIGAFLGEFLVESRGVWASFKASMGAFAGFIITTFAKLVVSILLFWKVMVAVF